jgi:aspartyl protease family protein
MRYQGTSVDDTSKRIGRAMLFAAWIAGLTILVVLFQGIVEERQNPNRDIEVSLDSAGRAQVALERNRAGHYVANGSINGKPVVFLVDTGATDVALPLPVAKRVGVKLGPARISRTANGDVKTWTTQLDRVDLGGLAVRGVSASVLPNMPGEQVLLGMSYLKRFELLQRDGTLTIRFPG